MADLITPRSFVDFIETLPIKSKTAISYQLECIKRNIALQPAKPEPVVVSDLIPTDILSLYMAELLANGWTEEEIVGNDPNPAEASIVQVLREGSKIVEIKPSFVKIQHRTGSVVHHDKPHRHTGEG